MGEDDRAVVPTADCGIPVPIPDEDHLWRRVKDHPNWRTFDHDRDRWLPVVNSPPLTFDPDFSAPWREHLELVHDLGPESVAQPGYPLVFQAQVGVLRTVTLDGIPAFSVTHTPAGTSPIGCAHASVDWPSGATKDQRKALRTDLSLLMSLCHGQPSMTAAPG